MRIFCAVRHSKDPNQFYGELWSSNFYAALKQLGHEIIESQTDLLPTSRFMHISDHFTHEELDVRAETTERILDEVRQAQRRSHIHLFLGYFYNAHFDAGGFDELRRLGILSVNFFCNSVYQFENVAEIAAKVDFSWHPERDAREAYLRVGARPVWVQMGANPLVYYPVDNVERKSKACFIGQRYADRDRWAAALIEAGVPLDLYGSGWGAKEPPTAQKNFSSYLGRTRYRPASVQSYLHAAQEVFGTLGFAAGVWRLALQLRYQHRTRQLTPLVRKVAKGPANCLPETVAGYQVVLNFSNVWADGRPCSELVPHVRLRDFEMPMCRSCYLTGYSDEIGHFYDLGKEIDTYRSPDELIDKSRYYLTHAAEADRLRQSGYLRARQDHTWEQRFLELFDKIGVNSNA